MNLTDLFESADFGKTLGLKRYRDTTQVYKILKQINIVLERDCQEYLKYNVTLYRGMRNTSQIFTKQSIRDDRVPKDSSKDFHNAYNEIILDAGLIANRSNSFFVTGSTNVASGYGGVYVCFPIGEFNWTTSNVYEDWYEDIQQKHHGSLYAAEDDFFDLANSLYGDSPSEFPAAVNSFHEIMIKPKSNQAYFLRETAWKQLSDFRSFKNYHQNIGDDNLANQLFD